MYLKPEPAMHNFLSEQLTLVTHCLDMQVTQKKILINFFSFFSVCLVFICIYVFVNVGKVYSG